MDFIVSPAVLIPRPETEHLIETVLPLARSYRKSPHRRRRHRLRRIALALAKELPEAEIHATDNSPAALEIAEANAARLQLEFTSKNHYPPKRRLFFHETNLLHGLERELSISWSRIRPTSACRKKTKSSSKSANSSRATRFSPEPTGLEVIEQLIPAAHVILKPGGHLIMEISGTIAEAVQALLDGWEDITIANDLQGIARIASARKPRN